MSAELNHAGRESPAITEEQAREGEWIMPTVSYINPERRFCAFTGRPIARRFWQVTVGERSLSFSDPAAALRYATYPKSSAKPGIQDPLS